MRKIIKIKFLRGAHGTSGPTRQLRPLGELCYERLMLRGGGTNFRTNLCVCFYFNFFFFSSSKNMKHYFWIELLIVWKISMLFYVVGVVVTPTCWIQHNIHHTQCAWCILNIFFCLFSFVMGGDKLVVVWYWGCVAGSSAQQVPVRNTQRHNTYTSHHSSHTFVLDVYWIFFFSAVSFVMGGDKLVVVWCSLGLRCYTKRAAQPNT